MLLSFSQRMGIKPVKSSIQHENMDEDLRNSLWNVLTLFYWEKSLESRGYYEDYGSDFFKYIWILFFKLPIDTMPQYVSSKIDYIRRWFFNASWNEVYDFIQFVAEYAPSNTDSFIETCNSVFERELSGYHFIDKQISPITSKAEISEIESALTSCKGKFHAASIHLETALKLFSDKTNPDYRNSIKESISAIEAVCKVICGQESASLGQALKLIEDRTNIKLHQSLKNSLNSLYGFSSDGEGIRHALSDEPNLTQEGARLMVVTCSAFVNYLIIKYDKSIK